MIITECILYLKNLCTIDSIFILISMKVPKTWAGVSVRQYYNLIDAIELPLSNEDKAIACVSALTDVSIEDLQNNIPIDELTKAIAQIGFISNSKGIGTPKSILKLGGKKIGFDMILRDSNASSFISLSELTKTPEASKKNIHNIIAIFCYELNWIGVRKKRTINSQKEIAELLKERMNMNDAFLYRDFFLSSYNNLLKGTLDYLARKHQKIRKELKKQIALHS